MGKPAKIELPDGETYRPMVLQVVEADERGGRLFRRLHEDESVNVSDGMAFWVVYARDEMLDDKPH